MEVVTSNVSLSKSLTIKPANEGLHSNNDIANARSTVRQFVLSSVKVMDRLFDHRINLPRSNTHLVSSQSIGFGSGLQTFPAKNSGLSG